MKSSQAMRSPVIRLTSFHDLPVFLISSSIVLRHVFFCLPLLLQGVQLKTGPSTKPWIFHVRCYL